ncbi:protein BREVIS RADIX-like 4, partial [Trifolium medium]|nr:protein BREVIS RADIX-like 4 [Trifolium medium]
SRLRNGGSESETDSEKFRRTRTWGKEMEARLKGISSGEGTPSSSSSSFGGGSGRRVVVLEEEEGKEWV